MNILAKSRFLALAIFILPVISINLILIFSQSFEFRYEPFPGNYFTNIKIYDAGDALRDKQDLQRLGFAIPYIDGTTSISRLGRVFPNNLIFKPLMIITGLFICFFWFYQKKIIYSLDNNYKSINKFFYLGLITGITLIIHSIFLGIKFDYKIFKFLLKLNLATCLVSALICKLYYVKIIKDISKYNLMFKNTYFKSQFILVYLLLVILFLSLLLLFIENSKTYILIVEWNYFIAIFLFYLLNYLGSKKINL